MNTAWFRFSFTIFQHESLSWIQFWSLSLCGTSSKHQIFEKKRGGNTNIVKSLKGLSISVDSSLCTYMDSIMSNVIGDDDSDRVAKTQVQNPKNILYKCRSVTIRTERVFYWSRYYTTDDVLLCSCGRASAEVIQGFTLIRQLVSP